MQRYLRIVRLAAARLYELAHTFRTFRCGQRSESSPEQRNPPGLSDLGFELGKGRYRLGHLSTERFLNQAGLQMVHVPYRGQAPTTLAIFAGEVDILLTTTSDTLNEHIRSGKVKLLGVSSPGPSPVAPGAASIGSALKGYSVETWFGILAPAGTPPDVLAKLNAALGTVLAMPQIRDRFLSYGVEAKASTPAELHALIAAEIRPGAR
ncbi:tripartite-type tricarboxylate transporter receptor subunit TctC [Bradyrhizobium yuanmingense]|uniref:tripartite tricarboxylate transporter substrate-binding protein n=1 Tax=Bradyrhizobium yuanmingense TaxID=108015 RepID=UPI003519417F